jgi:hypothetical protein
MFIEFKEISKDDWLQKIVKEYRGQKSFEDLHLKIEDILEIHPFHHVSDKVPSFKINPFPNFTRFGVQVPKVYDQQKQLLPLLDHGIQLLFFDKNAYWDEEEAKKIHWDYLFTIAHQDSQAANFIRDFLSKRRIDVDNNLFISKSQNTLSVDLGSIYDGTTSLKAELEEIQNLSNEVVLFITLSDHFLFNIGLMRGIKSYLQDKYDAKKRPLVIAQCEKAIGSQEESLVSETVQITSAVLSGVEHVLFSPNSKAWIQQYQSMIPHLLQEESHLNFREDPISGSGYIDSVSWQIFDFLQTNK